MAPAISSSNASTSSDEAPRAQAGPLPVKRGEIGFTETEERPQANGAGEPATPLPARHPADRDPLPSATLTVPLTPATNSSPNSPRTPNPDSPTTAAKAGPPGFWGKTIFCGFRLGTFILFTAQFLLFAGTIAGWAVAIVRIPKSNMPLNTVVLFIHIAFAAFLIVQFIFLERRLFRLRGERYAFLHPGEILPTSRRLLGSGAANIAFSPWNRPPLPTYAAALAQSGVGTGDVEDHLIAAPPPPAYGNTRGSRMLLSGHLRDSLRAQRPVSLHSQLSARHDDRPLSYASKDERWEEIQDADRARRLEETLARLDRPQTRS